MGIQVVGHTSFLGHTGYNNHSKNFFNHLNKYIPVRIRNYSYVNDLSYLKPEEKELLIQQDWNDPPYKIGRPFNPNPKDTIVNLVLNESHHYFFYDHYDHPMIAYNVWESTKQIPEYFKRVLEYDQFWCPTEWQRQCTIDQGYPADRVKVVPEAVNGSIFLPPLPSTKEDFYKKYNIPTETFMFMIFGRWDDRKATSEMIQAFCEEFKDDDNIMLVVSVDNPFASDGMKTTEERLKHYKFPSEKIKIVHFPPREDYVKFMQHGNVLLSCSRSEGWNLPLMEALACGTPSIASNWGGHLEFADGIAHLVNVPKEVPPKAIFLLGDKFDFGVWGEPDFDHLKKIMREVYNNYPESKQNALKRSKYIRQLYSWDNAARKGERYINELCSKIKPISRKSKDTFETSFEIVDGSPRVNFKPSVNHDGRLLVTIQDSDGEQHHEDWFRELKSNLSYWISLGVLVKNIKFEIFDEHLNLIYSETKVVDEIKSISQENTNEMELYQDQYVNGSVIVKGKRECESRYNAMKQVFEKYKRPFTILDIGANFGYYSIRACTEYDATAIMVERENHEIQTLLSLCEQNDCKDKLIVLQTEINLHKLKELSKCEHFDVVLALNVIHHFNNEDITEVCKILTKLGDNLILETPPVADSGACGQNNLRIITNYFNSL